MKTDRDEDWLTRLKDRINLHVYKERQAMQRAELQNMSYQAGMIRGMEMARNLFLDVKIDHANRETE